MTSAWLSKWWYTYKVKVHPPPKKKKNPTLYEICISIYRVCLNLKMKIKCLITTTTFFSYLFLLFFLKHPFVFLFSINSSLVGSKFLPICGYVILLCSTMGLGKKTAFYIILQFIQLSHHIMQIGLAFQDPQSCSKPMPESGVIQQIYYACVALSLW